MEKSRNKTNAQNAAFCEYRKKYFETCKWKGKVDAKLNSAFPYFFFLTGVKDVRDTLDEDLTITFPELLDSSLGTLEHSLHINFMVELPWLLAQYAINDLTKPSMTILYGVENEDLIRLPSHLEVRAIRVKSPYPYGHHHSKLSVFFYTDGSVRFAVYTANLIESDWEERTQGVWVSSRCPYLGDGVPINYGESETLFKVDILQYLNSYHLTELRKFLIKIQKVDCSSIKVCFVGSVPGLHRAQYGHRKLGELIKKHSSVPEKASWQLIAQISSIGSLGQAPDSWLCGEFCESTQQNYSKSISRSISVIYPSVENVRCSIYGIDGGVCLPYSSNTHKRQLWLNKLLMQWRSEGRFRSKVVPHMKSYTSISSDEDKLAWFLLTSANLSKAAWGKTNKAELLHIMSYEAGVLFLPKFLIGKDVFTIKKGGYITDAIDKMGFPLPFDIPLVPYKCNDKIFLNDEHF